VADGIAEQAARNPASNSAGTRVVIIGIA